MNNRTVCVSKEILFLLSGKKLTVTEIILQTSPDSSPDRSFLVEVIKILEKALLVTKDKDPHHKQRLFVSLTAFGKELLELIDGIKQYNQSYSRLEGARRRNFNISMDADENVTRNILRSRGWIGNELEKNHYVESFDNVLRLQYRLSRSIIDALMFRYEWILYNFEPNKAAHPLVSTIIVEEISHQFKLLHTHNVIREAGPSAYAFPLIRDFASFMSNLVCSYIHRSITEETKDVLLSIFCISKTPKALIENSLKILREVQKDNLDRAKNDPYALEHIAEFAKQNMKYTINIFNELSISTALS
jgi:DNA-binding MarR family transcriptional regulator